MLVEVSIFLIVLGLFWLNNTRLPSDHPPTLPFRLPILGHFHLLAKTKAQDTTTELHELYKKYGKKKGALSLFVGTSKITLLGDYALAKEALSNNDTNSRIYGPEMWEKFSDISDAAHPLRGIVMNHGKSWHELRRFTQSKLRDFGFGKTEMEVLINEEVQYFMEHMDGTLTDGVMKDDAFHIAVLNILWQIVAGIRYEYTDSRLLDFMARLDAFVSIPMSQPTLVTFLPFLKGTMLDPGLPSALKEYLPVVKFLEDLVEKRKEAFEPGDIKDFIDAFLLEMKEKGVPGSPFHGEDAYGQLVETLNDLFGAGSDTISKTLAFGVLFLIRNPKVQEKVRNEIHEVIGQSNSPVLANRECLPYTEATIMEIQRMANILPEGVFHVAQKPVNVGPYTIPQGHMIMPDLKAILQDNWENGEKFDPQRFLDKNGKVSKKEEFIPFGVGKRACPGESLAKAELFLFIVGLLQRYRFEALDPNDPPPYRIRGAFTSAPVAFKFKFVKLQSA